MRKKITLTIDSDVYDGLEELPRKVSVSEFVNVMLKAYIEMFKRGHIPTQKETDEIVDGIIKNMGGEKFRERMRNTFPTLEKGFEFTDSLKDLIKKSLKKSK